MGENALAEAVRDVRETEGKARELAQLLSVVHDDGRVRSKQRAREVEATVSALHALIEQLTEERDALCARVDEAERRVREARLELSDARLLEQGDRQVLVQLCETMERENLQLLARLDEQETATIAQARAELERVQHRATLTQREMETRLAAESSCLAAVRESLNEARQVALSTEADLVRRESEWRARVMLLERRVEEMEEEARGTMREQTQRTDEAQQRYVSELERLGRVHESEMHEVRTLQARSKEEMEAQLAREKQMADRVRGQLEQLRDELERSKSTSELQQRQTLVNVTQLKARVRELEEVESERDALRASGERTRTALDALRASADVLVSENERLETIVNGVYTAVEGGRSMEAEALGRWVSTRLAQCDGLEHDVRSLKGRLSVADESEQRWRMRAEELERSVAEHARSEGELARQYEESEKRAERLEETVHALEETVQQLQSELTEEQKRLTRAESARRRTEEALQRAVTKHKASERERERERSTRVRMVNEYRRVTNETTRQLVAQVEDTRQAAAHRERDLKRRLTVEASVVAKRTAEVQVLQARLNTQGTVMPFIQVNSENNNGVAGNYDSGLDEEVDAGLAAEQEQEDEDAERGVRERVRAALRKRLM